MLTVLHKFREVQRKKILRGKLSRKVPLNCSFDHNPCGLEDKQLFLSYPPLCPSSLLNASGLCSCVQP